MLKVKYDQMRTLAKPNDDPSAVFLTCIGNVADAALKAKLAAVAPLIGRAATKFDAAATNAKLHLFPQHSKVGGYVTAKEMATVYRTKMAKRDTPARPIYDKLMAVPPYGRCPLCGLSIVATLDHHLPHTLFPALAVTPINLIPACFDCNKTKSDIAPATAEEQTLHPYFDDVEGERWLSAVVIESNPAAIQFSVDPPSAWSELRRARLHHHFKVFKLAKRYASFAAEELQILRQQMLSLHAAAGSNEVNSHLVERTVTCEAVHLNSWQSATYRALSESDWYIDGGFAQTTY